MSNATERLSNFVRNYRLRLTDTGAKKVVSGKFGELADMNDDDRLRLRLLAIPRSAKMVKALRNRREQAIAGGMTVKVQADAETILYFDPSDQAQASLAIKLVGARVRRQISPEQAAAGAARLVAAREARRTGTIPNAA